jgi:hypothetical protein
LPSTVIAALDVRVARTEPNTFGDGIRPYPFPWCSLMQMPSNPHCSAYTSCSMYRS